MNGRGQEGCLCDAFSLYWAKRWNLLPGPSIEPLKSVNKPLLTTSIAGEMHKHSVFHAAHQH